MEKEFRVYTIMYHGISEEKGDRATVSVMDFERQIKFFKENYLCPDPKQLIEDYKKGQKKNDTEDTILITFDDGYENNFRLAMPILKKYGLKAIVFLISGYIGENNDWNHKYPKKIRHMNLKEIKESKDVFYFGCHTKNHYNLLRLNDAELKIEIIESKKKLESILGYTVNTFSYPYGFYNKHIADFLSPYFDVSFSTYNKGENFNWNISSHSIRRIDPTDYSLQDFPEQIFKFRNAFLYK